MPNLSGIQQYDDPADPYGAQRTKIARKLALSQALQQKGMHPLETNRMSGGWAIPISPFEGLSQLAHTYAGVKTGQKAETERGELAQKSQSDYQAALVKALGQMETDPAGAIGTLSRHPQGAALMPLVMDQYKRQQLLRYLRPDGTAAAPQAPQPGQGEGYGVLAPGATPTQPQAAGGQQQPSMGGPAKGIPLEAYLATDPTGKSYISALSGGNEALGGVHYDQDGKAFVTNKQGQPQYLPGVSARDKVVSENVGGQIRYRSEYSPTPIGQPIQKTPTIGEQTGQRSQEVEEAKLARQGVPIPPRPAPQPIPQVQPPQPSPQPMPQPQPAGQQQIWPPTPQPQVRPGPQSQDFTGTPLAQNTPARSYSQAPGPIPGGAPMAPTGVTLEAKQKIAADRAADQPKAAERVQQAQRVADNVLSKVDDALNGTDWKTAGFVGAISRAVPGTPAFDLSRKIDTIKANIGFQELQQMRSMSPTGGALGQVAVQELEMLQATVASLDTAQSPEQLRQHLTNIKTHFERWKGTVEQNYGNLYGASQSTPARRTTDKKGPSAAPPEGRPPTNSGGWSIKRLD